jgi:phenylalanine-4-hydroxylase
MGVFFYSKIMRQNYENYSTEDQEVWKLLFNRQKENLALKGSKHYNDCLELLSPCLNEKSIPKFEEMNSYFKTKTGWQIEVVPGLIPVADFFDLLAEKKFCSSTWLRTREQIDYLEEPDMFHDIFGHIPLLLNSTFSKFAQAFGKLGQQYKGDEEMLIRLQRIYWFTIEFGLIKEKEELKVYGAGIASSFGETNHVFEPTLTHLKYTIEDVMECEFDTDIIQEKYFVIESLDELYNSLNKLTVKLKKTA